MCVETVMTNGWSFYVSVILLIGLKLAGAVGHKDCTGQRKPIHAVVQTYSRFWFALLAPLYHFVHMMFTIVASIVQATWEFQAWTSSTFYRSCTKHKISQRVQGMFFCSCLWCYWVQLHSRNPRRCSLMLFCLLRTANPNPSNGSSRSNAAAVHPWQFLTPI